MISSFKNHFTEQIFDFGDQAKVEGISSREKAKAFFWLGALNYASSPNDVNLAPDRPLERLEGNLWRLHKPEGWTITFEWNKGDAESVCLERKQ